MWAIPKDLGLRRWLTVAVHRPVAVLTLFGLLTLLLALQLPKLRFQSSVYDLAIEGLPETEAYARFKTLFGTEEIILVVVRTADVFAEGTFEALGGLSRQLTEIEGVRRVISLPSIRKQMDLTARWSTAEFREVIRPLALFEKNLVSADGKATVLSLVLEDIQEKGRVVAAVRQVLSQAAGGLSPYQIGLPVVSAALAESIERDFLTLPPLALLVMAAILYAFFRSLIAVVVPAACLLMVLAWTLGWMALSGTPLSMLTMIVPVFLIAVGTAYSLYILSEYARALRDSASRREAVFRAFSRTGFPTVLALATTVVGLASLLLNRIPAIQEFALFSCLGMIGLLAVLLGFLPALLLTLPAGNLGGARPGGELRWLQQALAGVVRLNLRHQKLTLSLAALAVAFAGAGVLRLKIETNPISYFRQDAPVYRHFQDVRRDLAGSFPMNVVLDGGAEDFFEDPRQVARIARVQEALETVPGVDKAISFADYLKLVNYVTHRFDPAGYRLPKEGYELRMLMNSYKSLLGQDLFERFMSPDLSRTTILLRTHLASSRDFLAAREEIRDRLKSAGLADLGGQATGLGLVIAQSSHLLAQGQIRSLSLTLLVIAALMLLLFMSARVALISLLPNLFPIIVCFGLMGWLGIEVSPVTSLIACVAIGLAVDDTIHYLFRYNREFRLDADKDRALRDTVAGVGPPMVFTTLTISLGFGVLLLSSFKPTALFGALMIVTMGSALIGDLILLPSLMLHVGLVTVWDLLKSLSTLDRMSDAVAHELNQPLNAIKMGSEFLKMGLETGGEIRREELAQVVGEIDRQVDRAAETIKRLGRLGRAAEPELQKVDINEPIRDVLEAMGHQLAVDNITLGLDLADSLPPILARRSRLRTVIFNLVTNAWEAILRKRKGMPGAGPHSVNVRSALEGGRVSVWITDTGIGFQPHERRRAFEPFFSTKETGPGKGLGLSVSYGIVRDYGGSIRLESRRGEGTTVRLAFPRAPF